MAVDDSFNFSAVSVAADATLALRPPPAVALIGNSGSSAFNAELHLVDRAGRGSRVGPVQRFSYSIALNPDGRRVAASIVDPRTSTQDLWLVDLQNGDKTPTTTTRGFANFPVWSPDSTRLAYAHTSSGQMDYVYIKDLRTGQVTPVIESPAWKEPVAWSHDGAYLVVYTGDEKRREQSRCVVVRVADTNGFRQVGVRL